MRVLITGVAGRVGSSLARKLLQSGYSVRGTVRPGGKTLGTPLSSEIEVVEASLRDTEALARAVSGVDVVVHLAAQMPMAETPVDEYFDINVGGTLRLLEAAANQNKAVRFVHASTDNTYGPARPLSDLIDENHPQVPGDYYGTSKVLCEHLVKNFHKLHGLEYTILRLGSILAPNETTALFRLDWIRAYLSAQAEAGRRGNLWQLFSQCEKPAAIVDAAVGARDDNPAVALTGPDGDSWSTHLTDVRDVVAGIVLAIKRPEAANEEFNIVGPHTTTFTEAAGVIADRAGVDMLTVQMPMRLAFELSTAKARRLLGYTAQWDFAGMVDSGSQSTDETSLDYVPVGAG